MPASSKKPAAPKPAQRVIKKYPNRRLYDTDSSSYITLAEVKQLVMQAQAFVVRDAKTNEDLTRSILLQIILEEEAGGAPMFSEAALSNIIRFYGHAMQGFMGSYLEKNVQNFSDLQAQMADRSPLMQGVVGSYMEQSKQLLQQMQEQMQKQAEQMLSVFGLKH
ncbi:MAG TPA: polyhydroxyalkanoate synthesis repressor PhaR [Burkholderiaceae bacterium]